MRVASVPVLCAVLAGGGVSQPNTRASIRSVGDEPESSTNVVLSYPASLPPAPAQIELLPADAEAGDAFGSSVSSSDNAVLVGALASHPSSGAEGAAYLFRLRGGQWTREAKLAGSEAQPFDLFGASVALEGDLAVVGAPADNTLGTSGPGSAYVFARRGGVWTENARLMASDGMPDDQFGSVALSGTTIVVGAKGQSYGGGTNPGSAYVFVWDGMGWVEQAKLTARDGVAGDEFGISVAVEGDTAVVGARQGLLPANTPNPGVAYVYTRAGTTWTQQAKLAASDPGSGAFGVSLSLSGNTLIVGANFSDSFAGAAYVFVGRDGTWSEQAKLTTPNATILAGFGRSVALFGNTAVIGAWMDGSLGSAFVFRREGTTWIQGPKLTGADSAPGDLFGVQVGLFGERVVSTSTLHAHAGGPGAGAAYVFRLAGG